jgi:hypothetical protein
VAAVTLKVRPDPRAGIGGRLIFLDCPHGTTRSWYVNAPGGAQLSDVDVIRYALVRHDLEEQCRCTEALWARYGPRVA